MKTCSGCGEQRPLDCFVRDRRRKDGHSATCKACKKRLNRAYYEANAERIGAHNGAYRLANRGRANAWSRQRYARDPQRQGAYTRAWRLKNRDRWNAYKDAWRRANGLVQYRGYQARRRDLVRATAHERVDYRAIWERDGGICYLCTLPVTRAEAHFDHVVPLSKGGPHVAANIAVAHGLCNLRKGVRPAPPYSGLTQGSPMP